MSCATVQRMKYSPVPVQETATESLSAYVPAPMIGESPMRPHRLFCVPPVEVPAARLPCWSSATAPTVPNLCSSGTSRYVCGLPFSFDSSFCSDFHRRSVQKYFGSTISNPACFANSSAPLPASMTCFDFSITARAAEIGFLMTVTPATDPAASVCPFMMAASISFFPSCVKTAPLPALNSGESSRMRMLASTASRLEPPFISTACPVRSASSSFSRYCFSISGVMLARVMVPAPPCMTSIGLVCARAVVPNIIMSSAIFMRHLLLVLRPVSCVLRHVRHEGHMTRHAGLANSCMKFALPLLAFIALSAAAQPPHEHWRTIETRHFRVHYPVRLEAWAARAASRMESIRDAVVAQVGFAPEQITDVLVVDPIADANGETIPLLDTPRMIFFAPAPGPELQIGEYSDWIDLLAVHETTHLVHLLRPSRNPFENFLERWLLPVDPIVLRAPRWIFEGYATVIEGRITGSGRPSGSMRAAILRKWALEGRLPTYGQLDSDRRFLGMSMAYLMGSAFLEWLEQRSGPDAMRHMWARLTARQRRSFDEAFIGVYGERPDKLYGEFVAQLTESAITLARNAPPREGELWQETMRGSGDLAVAPDGKALAMVLRNEKREAKLVVLSTGPNEEEEKFAKRIEKMIARDPQDVAPVRSKPLPRKPLHTLVPSDGGDITDPRWTRDGNSIVYTHKQPDIDGVLHEDLFRWTPDTGRNVGVTHLADVGDADPLPDGTRSVAVRNREGMSQIVFVDAATGAVTPMNEPSLERVYSHPRASADGNIAWAEHSGGVWHVGDTTGAFSPEWSVAAGSRPTLYAVLPSAGFIAILQDG